MAAVYEEFPEVAYETVFSDETCIQLVPVPQRHSPYQLIVTYS